MPPLVVKSLPEEVQIEPSEAAATPQNYWANRTLLPEWEESLANGAFSGGTDSTDSISEERNA